MNPEAKELWLAALRSGKYEQGKYYLLQNRKYCCLGVLCDVARENGVELHTEVLKKRRATDRKFNQTTYFDTRSSQLPTKVQDWAGLDDSLPSVEVGGVSKRLDVLNDSDEQATFEWLADRIEESL